MLQKNLLCFQTLGIENMKIRSACQDSPAFCLHRFASTAVMALNTGSTKSWAPVIPRLVPALKRSQRRPWSGFEDRSSTTRTLNLPQPLPQTPQTSLDIEPESPVQTFPSLIIFFQGLDFLSSHKKLSQSSVWTLKEKDLWFLWMFIYLFPSNKSYISRATTQGDILSEAHKHVILFPWDSGAWDPFICKTGKVY